MNNTIKRKVLAVGIVALFAFATTIGATFAWFTIGQSTDMDSIQLTVSSSTSLLIRMDDPLQDYNTPTGEAFYKNPLNYVSTLDNATILAAYPFNNIRMRTVTTTDGEVITYRDPLEPIQPSSSAATLGEGQYIEFKVWVLSQSNSVIVALQDYTITATNTNTNKNDVINAIRTSFSTSTSTLIYGVDKDYDFEFFVNDVGYTTDPDSNVINPTTEAGLILLHGEYYTTSGSGVPGESVDITDGGIAAATTLMQLTADVPVQVTIRIWVEGWDADSDNNVIQSQFNLAFTFAVKQVL